MKRGHESLGFTVVETLIFLAVSSALLVSAFTLIGGAQSKTAFRDSVNDITQQIDDTINNVRTGYYGTASNAIRCTAADAGGGALTITFAGSSRGENRDCVYLGRVMYFSTGQQFATYSVAGLRERIVSGVPTPVTRMADARPTAFGLNASEPERGELKNGLVVQRMVIGGTSTNTAAVGFFSTLGSAQPGGTLLQSQSLQYDYLAMPGITLQPGLNDGALKTSTRNIAGIYDASRNPSGGVKICFYDGATDQRAIVTVGGSSRDGKTQVNTQNGNCSAAVL